jgi:plastocyanin
MSPRHSRFSLAVAGAVCALMLAQTIAARAAGRIEGVVELPSPDDLTSAVVYVEEVSGRTFAPPAQPAVMEQHRTQFVPHVLPILRGTTVRFPNTDRVRHNIFSPSPAKPFNFGIYYPGEEKQLRFDELGTVTLLCNIHEQMSAYILVLQNPYFARVGPDGRYSIDGVPDGRYSVALWTERGPKVSRRVVIKTGKVASVTFANP